MSETATYTPRLRLVYDSEIRARLKDKLALSNVMTIPKLDKVVINMGIGDAVNDRKVVDNALEELQLIAGQRPIVTKAKTSIAAFKLREEMAIGVKVTLRNERMYEFIDRLVTIALPRVRDFRGLNGKSFDGRGNYAMGLKEHLVFPEIDYDKVSVQRGMDIVVCTTASNDDHARELLKELNFPFRK